MCHLLKQQVLDMSRNQQKASILNHLLVLISFYMYMGFKRTNIKSTIMPKWSLFVHWWNTCIAGINLLYRIVENILNFAFLISSFSQRVTDCCGIALQHSQMIYSLHFNMLNDSALVARAYLYQNKGLILRKSRLSLT